MITAWHFTGETLRDGRPIPPIGEWLEHESALVLCESGLHASERLLDALRYAPGLALHRVALDGEIVRGSDKLCAQRRRIDATAEVSLRAVVRFALEVACLAAWCAGLYLPELLTALEAADREDWPTAEAAVGAAAWAAWAAGNAVGAAARAAWDAVGAAAWATWAVGDAARDAARAAWAARDAARAAARAAWAARDAARDAAAVGAAVGAAALSALETRAVALLARYHSKYE